MVDGRENTVEAFGIQHVRTYGIETEHMQSPIPFYTNLDAWNDLSDPTQEVPLTAANDAASRNAFDIPDVEAEITSTLQGTTFVTPDGCLDLEAFKTACRELSTRRSRRGRHRPGNRTPLSGARPLPTPRPVSVPLSMSEVSTGFRPARRRRAGAAADRAFSALP